MPFLSHMIKISQILYENSKMTLFLLQDLRSRWIIMMLQVVVWPKWWNSLSVNDCSIIFMLPVSSKSQWCQWTYWKMLTTM